MHTVSIFIEPSTYFPWIFHLSPRSGRKHNRPDASCASAGGPASVDSCKARGLVVMYWKGKGSPGNPKDS